MESKISTIHKRRCEQDPCYNLFFFPETDNFLSQLLHFSIQIIEKKYGPRLCQDAHIAYAFSLLKRIDSDTTVRIFALMFMIRWESGIVKALESGYKKDTTLFKKFVMRLHEFVENTLRYPYDKHNIIDIVNGFEQTCRLEYIMGPTTNSM